MARDDLDPVGVYFGTSTGQLYGSADGGESWRRSRRRCRRSGRSKRSWSEADGRRHPARSLAALVPGVEHRTTVDGATVGEVITGLDRRWPGVADRRDSGPSLRAHINVFVDGEPTRALDQPVGPNATVHVIPAIAGGSGVADVERDVVSWADLDRLVADLADQVGHLEFDAMLAITRGGMVPAGMLAYRLGIRDTSSRRSPTTTTPAPRARSRSSCSSRPTSCSTGAACSSSTRSGQRCDDPRRDRADARGGRPADDRGAPHKPGRSRVAAVPDHYACRPTPGWSTRSRPGADGAARPAGRAPRPGRSRLPAVPALSVRRGARRGSGRSAVDRSARPWRRS